MMANHQSDGKNRLKRIEFVFNGKSYKFALNPEEYTQSEPNRVTVTQTKSGAWLDEFGAGVPTITIRGTTGLKNGSKDATKGYAKFKELRDMIRSVYSRVTPGMDIPSNKEMKFYNYTDGDYWIVTPSVFEINRSVSRSLLYIYNIQLIGQRKISEPSSSQKSSSLSITSARRY